MTQLKCPECGKEFDDTKQVCPDCGCPINLMASVIYEKQSKLQLKMVSLALPIGILAILMATITIAETIMIKCRINGFSINGSFEKGFNLANDIVLPLLLLLALLWFVLLLKGSVKNTSMRSIAITAIIGSVGWLLASLLVTTNTVLIREFSITIAVTSVYISWISKILLSISFIAICVYFSKGMKAYSLMTGGALLINVFVRIMEFFPNVFGSEGNLALIYLDYCTTSLYYLSIALFFFGFNKTIKS